MHDPDLIEPAPARLPSQLWQPWTLIVPALLILPLLGLAFAWQSAPGGDEVLQAPRASHTRPGTEPHPVPTTPPLTIRPQSVRYFVPGTDGKLHAKKMAFIGGSTRESFEEFAGSALENLFAASPEYFPRGTHAAEMKLYDWPDAPVLYVAMNDTFWDSDYWNMDSRPHLVIEALAHTLNDVYKQCGGENAPLRVQILRGDKGSISEQLAAMAGGNEALTLGQDDVSDWFLPDNSVVAPS